MIRGLYTSATGMLVQQNNQDTIANNLANVQTTGFQKERAVTRQFPQLLIRRLEDMSPTRMGFGIGHGIAMNDPAPILGNLGTGAMTDQIWTDYSRAGLRTTGNPTDLALNGRGYFVIRTDGGDRYTRNGAFTMGPDGRLMTQSGAPVQGQGGDIIIPPASNVAIDEQGNVSANGEVVDQLRIVDFPDPLPGQPVTLVKQGDSLFAVAEGANATPQDLTGQNGLIRVGALENSNVNVVQEMVHMIEAARAYEANQKAITAQDGTLDKVCNEVGRA
ncbi:flagellar basal-body rod protein FlgF [Heliophilum fasciatum]|uniref:Flagellar basal-body rod protein FlgG n=1 Tax=Heliophilum fasciatum TaxID=35700 RepID=A0A4R2RPT1_9FIRM|nr:flagellar basal-body rod protein FlgF [Heliophilum fasciatum]MCW2277466.1 flagellar basal-body rod protein FlgG [Heliophilum fasciatum]TCP65243.1 flagellar basal-body rod protein FlgG [Heliophilum fasciatum]